MSATGKTTIVSTLAAAVLVATTTFASSACVGKGGQGTNTTQDGAKFQAYEALLQATDWGSWASWMSSSQKYGVAPGYKVQGMKFRCKQGGGLGWTCIVTAKMCK